MSGSNLKEMEPTTKVAKIENEPTDPSDSSRTSFAGFRMDKVINDNSQRKLLVVTGSFNNVDDKAVVLLEKQPFSRETVDLVFSKSYLKKIHDNDIYSTYAMHTPSYINGIKSTIIYPASEKHIRKYTTQEFFSVTESIEDYLNITLPYLKEQQLSLQWVYNILDKKSEVERVFFEDSDADTGFMMVPDMKWDMQETTSLYVTAIVNKRGLKSLRDLSEEHLPLLQNIRDKGTRSIGEKYGVSASKLRVYFHYQPSYYHLHVHFTHVDLDAPGSGVDRARQLNDVITNLAVDPDYYGKASLTFTLKANDSLLCRFKEAGRL